MPTKPRLILHIGMHKTGSTSLQRFFVRNRYLLRLMGIDYPKARGADGRLLPKHNDLFLAITYENNHRGAPHPTLGPSALRVDRLIRRLRPGRTVVISAEGLSGPHPGYAKALAPLADRADVRIVCFLRRQDEWIHSFYKQMVMSREVRETQPFETFTTLPRVQKQLDYARLIRGWAQVFGAESIRVLIYPPRRSLLTDFVEAAQLPKALPWLPFGQSKLNQSYPASYIERVRLANRNGEPLPAQDGNEADHALVTEATRRLLMETYSEGNEWIRCAFRSDLPRLFD